MTAGFTRHLARLDATLDAELGETVSLVPMRAGDFAAMPDTGRPAFDVVALVDYDDPASAPIPRVPNARFVNERWRIEIQRARLAGRRIAKNDEAILMDRPGSPRVIVNIVTIDDPGRVVLLCGPIAD